MKFDPCHVVGNSFRPCGLLRRIGSLPSEFTPVDFPNVGSRISKDKPPPEPHSKVLYAFLDRYMVARDFRISLWRLSIHQSVSASWDFVVSGILFGTM